MICGWLELTFMCNKPLPGLWNGLSWPVVKLNIFKKFIIFDLVLLMMLSLNSVLKIVTKSSLILSALGLFMFLKLVIVIQASVCSIFCFNRNLSLKNVLPYSIALAKRSFKIKKWNSFRSSYMNKQLYLFLIVKVCLSNQFFFQCQLGYI